VKLRNSDSASVDELDAWNAWLNSHEQSLSWEMALAARTAFRAAWSEAYALGLSDGVESVKSSIRYTLAPKGES
jgi:hypothetical protein